MASGRKFHLGAALAVCFLLFTFAAQGLAAEPKTIKVSAVLSLTGPMAEHGTQLKLGYDVLVEKVNAAGGVYVKEYGKKIPVELRVLDDESSGQKTQTQLEAANSWGAVANVGGLGCASFEMGTPICQKNKMCWIGPGCAGWAPHNLGNEWLFSNFAKTPYIGPMIFEMIMEQPEPRPRKVAVFEINQLDAQEAMSYWSETAKKLGFQIVFHQKYPAGTKDFSAMITGAKAAGAEILLAYPVPPEGPAIVKQMKELDFAPKVVHFVRSPEGAGFGPALGPLADYVTLPVAWSDKYRFPENDYLIAKAKEKTGKGPDLVAGNAYSAGQVLFAAIEKAGTLDRTAIRNAIKATDMMTISGPIKFSKIGHPQDKVLVIAQWMGGDRKIVYTNEFGKKYPKEVPVTPLKYMPKWSERGK
ncbi:MAG: amino acid ABC transporter substrate-binding protein [Deltaproteobacteria bacterium]|nr:amino acid ABC transporter substrate-binding protein [Deltaproteobacteria bacterium]